MLPPTLRILARGTALVLGLVVLVAGAFGLQARDALVALNTLGFVGVCALSITAIVRAVALERIGLDAARKAATVLVAVLGGSAVLMSLVLAALLHRSDIAAEAARFGLHSVAGIVLLVVLVIILVIVWRDRR